YRDHPKDARPGTIDSLHERIRKMLGTYHRFLGCAVRNKLDPDADINLVLSSRFGFVLPAANTPAGDRKNIIIGALAVTAASLFLLVVIAAFASGLWNASPFFPSTALDAFLWSVSAISAHGVAIHVADRMRARAIARNRWFQRTSNNVR